MVLKAISPKPQDRFQNPIEFSSILQNIIKAPSMMDAPALTRVFKPVEEAEPVPPKTAEPAPVAAAPVDPAPVTPQPTAAAAEAAPILNKAKPLRESAPLLSKVNPLAESAPILPRAKATETERPRPKSDAAEASPTSGRPFARSDDDDADIPLEKAYMPESEVQRADPQELQDLQPIKKSVFGKIPLGRSRSKYNITKTPSRTRVRKNRKRNRIDLLIAVGNDHRGADRCGAVSGQGGGQQ